MEGQGGCWAVKETETLEERVALLGVTRVPLIFPGSERKRKALGLGGARVGEHVALPFGMLGYGLEGLAPLEVDRSRIGILQVMKGFYSECFEE